MGFDKVFVYLVDNYFKKGKASGLYNDEVVVQNIIDRGDKLRPLLLGSQAPELFMIKAEDYTKMKALGFEDAKSSQELTKLYYKNLNEITNRYVKLSDVKAACTILVFWDADCSHCQTEIPVLLASYNDMLKENIDVKVFSVYTQYEVEKYIKYIKDYQLPWVNVYDGAHFNNIIQKYDVYSTPVIYLLDQNKVIQAKRIQASDVKSMIKTLEKKRK
jgi:alkyl hydroperoxide reductase subunit AhpC